MNLREWMDQECIEVKQLAGKLNVSRHAVHLWLSGKTIPLRVHRAQLQKLTKNQIKIEDWDVQGKIDKRVRGSKDNGLHSAQCVGNDKATKSKSKKS